MWSCGWPQWPIQQAMYQNLPHEQVDWAALAKQWIDMQKTGGEAPALNPSTIAASNGPVTSIPINSLPLVTSTTTVTLSESFRSQSAINQIKRSDIISVPMTRSSTPGVLPLTKHSSDNPPANTEGVTSSFWDSSWDNSNSTSSVGGTWTPASASVPVPPVVSDKPPFNFGDSIHGNLPLQAQSYDYNHGSDPYINQQNFNANDGPYPQYWTSSGAEALPPFLRKDSRIRNDENLSMNSDDLNQMCNLDAAKRKQLPIWIREGLEKMERDRQRQQEKERLKQEYEERRANQTLISGDLTAIDEESKNEIKKSRFDSESEADEEQNEAETKVYDSKVPVESLSFIKESLTEEEMMLKVRRMLTEILLEVTNEEVDQVAREVYQRARSKAPARQLASSTALASITGAFGGLSGYGSGGSNNESEKDESSSDDENSDDQLERIITEKKNAFVLKELEIEEMLKAEENEKKEKAAIISNESNFKINDGKAHQNLTQLPELKLKQEPVEEKSAPNSTSTGDSETSSDTEGSETSKSSPSNKSGRVVGRKHKEKSAGQFVSVTNDRDKKGKQKRSRSGSRNRSRSRSRNRKSRSRSRNRKSRSRSRNRKSRSRSRNRKSRSRSINRKSWNRSRNRKSRSHSRNRKSRSRSRNRKSRSRSRNRKSRSHSRNRKSRSRSRNRKSRSRSRNRKSRSRSRNRKSRSRSRNRKSRSRSRNRKSRSRSRNRKSRSRSRNRKSRSHSRNRKSRSQSRSKRYRSRSKTKNREFKKRTSVLRSRSRSYGHDFNKSKLKRKRSRTPSKKQKQVNSDNKSHGQDSSSPVGLKIKGKSSKSQRRDSGSSSSDSLQSGKKSC